MSATAAAAAGFLVGAAVFWLFQRRRFGPAVAELKRALGRWAVGDLAEPINLAAFSPLPDVGAALEAARAEQWRVFNEGLREVTLERLRLETLVRQLGDGVILCNLRGQVLRLNPAAARLLGIRPGEVAMDTPETRAAVQSLLKRRTLSELIELPGGACYADVAVLEMPSSDDVSVSVILRDASARRRGERMTEDSFRAVAEELRGPIRSLQGALRLLAASLQPDKRQKDYLDAVARSADDLTALLDEALDAVRLASGRLVVSPMPCDPAAVVRRCAEEARPLAEPRGLVVAVKVADDRPDSMDLDERLIGRVLRRLAAEAAGSARRGGALELGLSRSGPVRVQFWIALAQAEAAASGAAAAFEAAAPKLSQPPVGRAVEVCRRLVEAHGGELRSEPGRWTLILPLRRDGDAAVTQG